MREGLIRRVSPPVKMNTKGDVTHSNEGEYPKWKYWAGRVVTLDMKNESCLTVFAQGKTRSQSEGRPLAFFVTICISFSQ